MGTITALSHTVSDIIAGVRAASSTREDGLYGYRDGAWFTFGHLDKKEDVGSQRMGKTIAVGTFPTTLVSNQYLAHLPLALSNNSSTLGQHQSVGIPRFGANPSLGDSLFPQFSTDSRQSLTLPWVVADGNQKWTALNVDAVHSFINPSGLSLTDSQYWARISYGADFQSSFTTLAAGS